MAVLDVGRIHARYHGVDLVEAAALDESLRRVAAEGLADALLDAADLPSAYAVCVESLHVDVDLEPGRGAAALVRPWSSAIAAALDARLLDARAARSHGHGAGDGSDVVVYEREVDLLLDVVRSLARGDESRAWAWVQCGVVDPTVAGCDIAHLLARRPEQIPAVVRAAADDLGRLLDLDGWLRVAQALAEVLGARTTASAATGDAGPATSIPGVAPADVEVARGLVPPEIWRAASTSGHGELLATMGLGCVDPALVRRRGAATALLAAMVALAAPDGGSRTADPNALGFRAEDPGADVSLGAEGLDPVPTFESRARDAEPPVRQAERSAHSSHGGVLFLVHGISAIDLPAELATGPLADIDDRLALRWVLASATGTTSDDPAVCAASGWPVDPSSVGATTDPAGVVAAEVGRLAAALERWVRTRLSAVDDEDLGWLWDRSAALTIEPGWIDATFSLSDVDLRVRTAGLDLDPGFVWWLGSVVRFRYV